MNKKFESKYMMATTANHKLGDISREQPDLCVVSEEDENNYIGNWVFGLGFIDVEFPKSTTRELTEEEIEKYHGKPMSINGHFFGAINIKNEVFNKPVKISKKGTDEVFTGLLVVPLKKGGQIICVRDDTGCLFQTSRIQEINGEEIHTKNSVYVLTYLLSPQFEKTISNH